MQIILVSHALTQWNVEGRLQGHTDVPLNLQGKKMAECLAIRLAREPIHAIYASDLKRAIQTATPVAQQKSLDILQDIRLREGRLLGQETSSIYPTLPFDQAVETRADLSLRMAAVMSHIGQSHEGETVLVVSHAGALNVFISDLLEKSGGNRLQYLGIRMALNRFRYDSKTWHSICLNEDNFLRENASLFQNQT